MPSRLVRLAIHDDPQEEDIRRIRTASECAFLHGKEVPKIAIPRGCDAFMIIP